MRRTPSAQPYVPFKDGTPALNAEQVVTGFYSEDQKGALHRTGTAIRQPVCPDGQADSHPLKWVFDREAAVQLLNGLAVA